MKFPPLLIVLDGKKSSTLATYAAASTRCTCPGHLERRPREQPTPSEGWSELYAELATLRARCEEEALRTRARGRPEANLR